MRLVLLALVLALGVVVVNDGGRYARTKIELAETTDQLVDYAAASASVASRETVGGELQLRAEERGARVSQFQVSGTGVEVWTEDDVIGTWVLGPFLAWRQGKPQGTDPVVTDYGSVGY